MATVYGLTSEGFVKKTLNVIKTDMENSIKAKFGIANVDPESVFGQEIGVISEVAGDIWDLAELVYMSQYPASADGVSLDNVADLNNLKRLDATKSSVVCVMEGTEFTNVPSGTEFRQVETDELFEITSDTQITSDSVLKTVISVNLEASSPYTIWIDSDTYVSSESVALDILNDLKTQIDASGIHSAEVDTVAETITITPDDLSTPFGVSVSSNLDIDEIWTPVACLAVNEGKLSVPANSVVYIETPVSGLNQVDNLLAGVSGVDDETDDNFRIRRKQSLRVTGAATVPAIEARILAEVDNVTACIVKDNREDVVDGDGRPPHSFESIVSYPLGDTETEQAIADKIWEVGGGGIETHGNISKIITDSTGDSHIIKFSRPTDKYVHINIEITENPEETPPADLEGAIKQALVNQGDLMNAGEDLIIQKYYTAIYSIPGVATVSTLEHDVTDTPGGTPSYVTTNITIAANEIAQFDTLRITVTVL